MDTAQIMMVPATAGVSQTAPVPGADAAGSQGSVAGLFSTMLLQNLVGEQDAGSQSGVLQNAGQIESVLSADSISLLTNQSAEQHASAKEPDLTDVNQLAAYAQLAILQANLAITNPLTEKIALVPTTEATAVDAVQQDAEPHVAGLMQAAPVVEQMVVTAMQTDAAKPLAAEERGSGIVASAHVSAVLQGVPGKLTSASTATALSVPADGRVQPEGRVPAEAVVQQVVKNQDASQAVVQKAAEAQPLPQELTGNKKTVATVVPQPVRFAHQAEVVVAATGAEGQKNPASDQQNQGSQLMTKSPAIAIQGEIAKPEVAGEVVSMSRVPDQHGAVLHVGHQAVDAACDVAAEPVKAVPQETVGRQVIDRLASHEIKQGNDQISLKLSPENLGNIQLNMRMEDQRLKLEIVAENRGVRDALLQQADELKESLARQNIKIDSFNVTTSSNGNQSQQSHDWRQAAADRNPQQLAYAARSGAHVQGMAGESVRYFAPQYQSTLDVRF